ncbi:MAG: peptidase S58 [Anaerolineaceae bacterium 4572_5.1]|nr:MAG: peptidase S58 [Anaerolinea sp. 4484_236]OQY32584.1 MAG: peptidase S58 [Anaerolineaceae bacterium 4572_5.1]
MNAITDIPGIEVGQAQDADALTGCTVILCRKGAVGGVDQRGGAPGTRETDLLNPVNLVSKIHAILLSGGSAFGLDAASGVMRYLEENQIGFNVGVARVPIVPAAVLFDLAIGSATVRPDAEMGYRAAASASADAPAEGNIGAGMGATVGKILGMKRAMKSGLGTASMEIGGGVIVGAIVAVNAFGDVVDPQTGAIVAGARSAKSGFANTLEVMKSLKGRIVMSVAARGNTVIGVVATNAKLTKSEATKVAQMAQDGLARTIRPSHTMLDGDTIFALSTGRKKADVSTVGSFAAEVMEQAILQGVKTVETAGNLPGWKTSHKI